MRNFDLKMTTFFRINILKKCGYSFKFPYFLSVSSKFKMLGVFWKIQEICSKMGTRILKIDLEMTEIIDPKVGNPL